MTGGVLILNRNWQPIRITSVKRAFLMLYRGAAQAIDRQFRVLDFNSWCMIKAAMGQEVIHTVDRSIPIPRVLILPLYDRIPPILVRFSRQNIYARDRNTCQYCGRRLPRHRLNLDHVIPKSEGGKTCWQNAVCCCLECNLRKGNRTPEMAGMRLINEPRAPSWQLFLRSTRAEGIFNEWLTYLSAATGT